MNNQERSESVAISWDTIFSLGSNPLRLALIRVLAAHDRRLTVNDVTKEIVARETGKEVTDLSGDELTRCMTMLHHNHIPRLIEVGAVMYDSERGIVDPTEKLEVIHSRLESV